MNLVSALQSEKKLVDVRGFEPLTPCLQSRLGKTLKCFDGVAYTDNQRNSRSSNVPKLSRISHPRTLSELFVDLTRPALIHPGSLLSAASSVSSAFAAIHHH
jgi:hypothetical protein